MTELEAQVEKLTQENQELKARPRVTSIAGESPASDGSSSHFQDLVTSVRNVVVEPSRQPRFLGQSSGITLAKLVMAAIRIDALPAPVPSEQRLQELPSPAPPAEASLPPRHAADHLVEVYFHYRTPHLPILERSQAEETLRGQVMGCCLSGGGQSATDGSSSLSGARAIRSSVFSTP